MNRLTYLLMLFPMLGAGSTTIEKGDLHLTFSAPDSAGWDVKQNGDLQGAPIYVFAELETVQGKPAKQLSVTVIPSLPKYPTLDTFKDGWEAGFLKKSTKKLFSDFVKVGGISGYRVAGAVTKNGIEGEVMAVAVIYQGHNYYFSIFHVGPGVKDDPDFKGLLDSVKFAN